MGGMEVKGFTEFFTGGGGGGGVESTMWGQNLQ